VRAAALLLLALGAAGCVVDTHAAPVPGRDARVVLGPGGTARRAWPAAWSRGARFLVENRTGAPVETILVDLTGEGAPEELVEAVVEDPPGAPAAILGSPVGQWPLRARVGNPGAVLLPPDAVLSLVLRVEGKPGRCVVQFEVPK
jgi:hypothetical protein